MCQVGRFPRLARLPTTWWQRQQTTFHPPTTEKAPRDFVGRQQVAGQGVCEQVWDVVCVCVVWVNVCGVCGVGEGAECG